MPTVSGFLGVALLAGLSAGLLAGCSDRQDASRGSAAPLGAQLPATEPDTASSKDFGSYVVHFNALLTADLTPEVASNFGIVRSPNQVMVNLSVTRKMEGEINAAIPATVSVSARNLASQDKGITIREIQDGDAIYYIGVTPVINEETLVFTVEAIPEGESRPLSLQFKRQFFTN